MKTLSFILFLAGGGIAIYSLIVYVLCAIIPPPNTVSLTHRMKNLLKSIIGIGIGLLVIFVGKQAMNYGDKSIRISGPEKVAVSFITSKDKMAFMDPEIKGTEKERDFKNWERTMLSGIYARMGKHNENRLDASEIADIEIESVALITKTGESVTVEIKGSMVPHGYGYKRTYVFPKRDFRQVVDLIKRDQQWYVIDFK